MDGFSTTGQIDIAFQGSALDAASLCTPSEAAIIQQQIKINPGLVLATHPCLIYGPNVLLIPLNITGDALDLQKLNTANPFLVEHIPIVRAEVLSLDQQSADEKKGNVLRLSPLKPLKGKTKYLVVLLDSVRDINGKKIGPSVAYHQLGSELDTTLVQFQTLQQAIRSWEKLGEGFIKKAINPALSKDNIVLAYTFTTTATTDILKAIAAPATFNTALSNPAFDAFLPTPKPRENYFYKATELGADANPLNLLFTQPSVLFQGVIKLPSYLKTPTAGGNNQSTIVKSFWEPDLILGSLLAKASNSTVSIPPADKTVLDTKNASYEDAAYNVTYRYPFPKKQNDETVAVTVMTPNLKAVQEAAATQGATSNAAAALKAFSVNKQWPVIIFAHGITVDRSASLILANTLASGCLRALRAGGLPDTRCFAVATIDLPLHGVAASGATIAIKKTDGCSNLTNYFPVLDDLNHTVISGLDAKFGTPRERHFGWYADSAFNPIAMDYDNKKGSSGTLFMNLANMQTSRDNLRQAVVDFLNLNASLKTFDLDKDGSADLDASDVYFIGHSLGGLAGIPFVATNNDAEVLANNPSLNRIKAAAFLSTSGNVTKLIENSPSKDFGASRILAGLALSSYDPTSNKYLIAQGTQNLEKYLYIFQSMFDSVDPVNFIEALNKQKTPLLVTEFSGGETEPKDQVMPLAADSSLYPSLLPAMSAPFKHHLAGYCPFKDLNNEACSQKPFNEQHSKDQCLDGKPALPDLAALPAPLTGTEGLARLLALNNVDPALFGTGFFAPEGGVRLMVRFNRGNHGTPIIPIIPLPDRTIDETAVFGELVTEISSLFSSGGAKIAVGFVAPNNIVK